MKDFNIWVFLTNNLIFVWYVLLRIYFSFLPGVDIIYLTYGFILASSFDGVVIKSFSTYLLERAVNIKFNIKKTFIFVFLICLIAIVCVLFFGPYLIKLVFGLSEKFSESQLEEIFNYFLVLLLLVCSNGLCNLVFQKVFAGRRLYQFNEAKKYVLVSMFLFVIISFLSFIYSLPFEYLIYLTIGFSIINFFYIIKLLYNDRAF